MKINSKYKLKASTLIEVLVAMVVIMINYGAIALVVTQINMNINNRLKLRSLSLMDEIIANSILEKEFTDEVFNYNTFTIEKIVSDYERSEQLKVIHLNVINKKGWNVLEKKIVVNKEKEIKREEEEEWDEEWEEKEEERDRQTGNNER